MSLQTQKGRTRWQDALAFIVAKKKRVCIQRSGTRIERNLILWAPPKENAEKKRHILSLKQNDNITPQPRLRPNNIAPKTSKGKTASFWKRDTILPAYIANGFAMGNDLQ